jgi:hypothetical protein
VEKERKPWWLYLNLLGLDAPLVAVMWLFLFARTWRVDYHPWQAYVALGLAVWTIRVASKLLAGSMYGDESSFVMIHQVSLRRLAITTGVLATVLTVLRFPISVYNYLLVGGLLVLGYFALHLFSTQDEGEVPYARHAIGGTAFAFGTALAAHVYLPSLGIQQLLFSREFICFAVLCMLAYSATDMWEHSEKTDNGEMFSADELALSLPLTLLGAAALVFAVQNDSMTVRPFFYGILTGAALLQVLNRTRTRFNRETLKVLTSLCLLAPGIIFQTYPMSN